MLVLVLTGPLLVLLVTDGGSAATLWAGGYVVALVATFPLVALEALVALLALLALSFETSVRLPLVAFSLPLPLVCLPLFQNAVPTPKRFPPLLRCRNDNAAVLLYPGPNPPHHNVGKYAPGCGQIGSVQVRTVELCSFGYVTLH